METPFCSMKDCELDLKKKKIVFGRTDYENENKNIGIKLGIEHSRNMFVMDIDDDHNSNLRHFLIHCRERERSLCNFDMSTWREPFPFLSNNFKEKS